MNFYDSRLGYSGIERSRRGNETFLVLLGVWLWPAISKLVSLPLHSNVVREYESGTMRKFMELDVKLAWLHKLS